MMYVSRQRARCPKLVRALGKTYSWLATNALHCVSCHVWWAYHRLRPSFGGHVLLFDQKKKCPPRTPKNALFFGIMNSEDMTNYSSTKHFVKFQHKLRPSDMMTFFIFGRKIRHLRTRRQHSLVVRSIVFTTVMIARLMVQLPPKPRCCVLG